MQLRVVRVTPGARGVTESEGCRGGPQVCVGECSLEGFRPLGINSYAAVA